MTCRYETREVICAEAEWDDRIEGAGGNVFQSSAWARLVTALGGEPRRFEILEGDRVAGFAVGHARRSRYPLVGRFRDRIIFETTPVVLPGHDVLAAIDSLAFQAKRDRFAHFTMGTIDGALESMDGVPPAFERKERLEFRVPLPDGFDAAFSAMSSSHRRNVRKARKEGFTLTEDSTWDGAVSLRDLQDATFERREELGHTRGSAWAREGYRKTVQTYLDAGVMRYWFAELDGERVSGVGILTFAGRAYYLVGGTSPRGYESRAAFFVFDEVIRRLIDEGVRVLNLGGTPAVAEQEGDQDHGLYRFKAGLGSRILRLATLSRRL